MFLVETDLLSSFLGHGRHEEAAKRIFNAATGGKVDLAVSAMSFYELDLLIKSGTMKSSKPPEELFEKTAIQLEEFGIQQVTLRAEDTAQSIRFRKKYGLTLLDSYYAAQAHRTQFTLLSYDADYPNVKEVRHQHPDELIKELEKTQ